MPEKQKCELGDQQMDVETNPEGRVDGCLDQNPVAVEDSGSVILPKDFWIQGITCMFNMKLNTEMIPVFTSLKILRHKFPKGH